MPSEGYHLEQAQAKAERHTPALVSIKEQFEKAIITTAELLDGLDNRMHNILNNRAPEKGASLVDNNLIENDFISSMNKQLSRLHANNQKLQQISNHLDKIV